MTYSVEFKKVSQQKPRKGEFIFWIDENKFYGGYEVKMGEVDYVWDEIDENGKHTGSSTFYHEGDGDSYEGHRLAITCEGSELFNDVLWCPAIKFDEMLDNASKDN